MSQCSNHFPEVIEQMNAAAQEGERPPEWDLPPTDEELEAMAQAFGQKPVQQLPPTDSGAAA